MKDPNQQHTNKDVLINGISLLAGAAVTMFIGPTLFFFAFSDDEKSTYIPLLIVASIVCIAAVYLAFKGIKTIVKSIFDN